MREVKQGEAALARTRTPLWVRGGHQRPRQSSEGNGHREAEEREGIMRGGLHVQSNVKVLVLNQVCPGRMLVKLFIWPLLYLQMYFL